MNLHTVVSAAPTSGYLQIRLLGPFAVVRDGETLEIERWPRRTDSLLRLLACASDHRRSREDVIALFWPEASPAAGSSNLRCTLHHLRRILGQSDPPFLLADRTHIALNAAHTWETDLARFEELARTAGSDIPQLVQAAALYGGEPLPDDRYEDWAAPLRHRIQGTWRDVCLRLARAYQEQGDARGAARYFERVLESDPLDEEAVQGLLKILLALGQRSRALREYHAFERRLRDELHVAPDPQTVALVAEIRDEEETPAPQRKAVAAPRPNPVVPSYPLSTAVPLIGRTAEVRQISEIIGEKPGIHLVLLAAEAGMGKTRLLAEVTKVCRDADTLTLAGGCYEEEGRLPYGPLHDALLDYVRSQPAAVLRSQLDDLLPDLARVVPELHERIPGIAEPARGTGGSQRLQLFSCIARAVERMAVERPLLLVIDDLHWADEETLQLVHFLLRQIGQGNITILGSYRREEVGQGSNLYLLAEAVDTDRIVTLRLPPLDRTDLRILVEERLGHCCSRPFVGLLHRRSLGNPFFTLQMLRLLQQEGRLVQGPAGWELAEGAAVDLPPEVRETIARRVRRLDGETRTALIQGAVLGREFPYPALEAMWEADGEALLDALDRALDAHLVGATDIGFAFRHPLLHEVIYEQLAPPRRAALHRRAALALEYVQSQGTLSAAELAHHFLLGGAKDRALPYLIRAGERAETAFAHEEAERHYRTALDVTHELGARDQEAEILVKLGDVLRVVGRYDEALQALERTVPMYRAANDLEAEAKATAVIGRVHFLRSTWEDGIARVQGLLHLLEARGPSRGLADLYVALVPLYAPTGRYAEYLTAAERASELSRSLEDERILAQAEMWRGLALAHLRRTEEARQALEGAVPLAERVNDLYSHGVALAFIGLTYILEGDLDRARTYREQAVDAFQRSGDPGSVAWGTTRLGDVYFLLGHWERARSCHERVIEIYRALGGVPRHSAVPLVSLGELALFQGNYEEASRLLDEGLEVAIHTQHLGALRAAQYVLAEKALLEGEPEQALTYLQPHPLLQRPGLENSIYSMLLPGLARAKLELGQVDDAAALVERGIEQAARQGNRIELPQWLRVRGLVLAQQNRWDLAVAAFEEAATLARGMSCPFEDARARYESGRLIVEMRLESRLELPEKDHERLRQEAREQLEIALAIFLRLGARPHVEQTGQVLADLGVESR